MLSSMFEKIQKLLDRIESPVALWAILVQGGAPVSIGAISAYLSQGIDWIGRYGWFGWWIVFLLGALVTTTIFLAASWTRYAWVKASATRKWREQVDTINPLDSEFNKVRIKLDDLAHPATKKIKGKRIYNCDLVGPSSVFLMGNFNISHNSIGNDCAIVVLKEDSNMKVYPPANAVLLEDVIIFNSTIFGVTFFIMPAHINLMRDVGINFITLTGDQEIDSQ